jgi:hypothetical protein
LSHGYEEPQKEVFMGSAAARGVTIVTIVTLIFTPVWKNGRWHLQPVGKQSDTSTVECGTHGSCPPWKTVVRKVVRPPLISPTDAPSYRSLTVKKHQK